MNSASSWTRQLYGILRNTMADPATPAEQHRLRQAEDLVIRIKREAFVAGAESYRKFLINQAVSHEPWAIEQAAPGD